MKSLPVGIQNIRDIIEQDFTYVDKTGILHDLIKKKGFYFLSRPRRFGKSLTCSTLEAIFRGCKDLFAGLAISKTDYDWREYPVVRLDFSDIDHRTVSVLEESLSRRLLYIAASYHIDLDKTMSAHDLLVYLILGLSSQYDPVVIIIDEYDKPIIDHIAAPELALQMRSFMKSLYGVLKGASIEENLRFLFMTGVSKFSKVSIFSELNNLDDITLDERAAKLCGYTQSELETIFLPHIDCLAEHLGISRHQALHDLQYWYNGYRFSKAGVKVYNPFSILNCLRKRDFSNYWFASGTPTFMVHYVQKNPEAVEKLMILEAERITVDQFDVLALETYFEHMVILFVQAGYLTIKSFDQQTGIYQLGYPNYEVRFSMTNQIFSLIAHLSSVQVASFVERFRDALQHDNIELFCSAMQDFFVLLPHTVIIHREKFYQGVFFTIAKLIGARIDAEQATSRGYIDAVLEGGKNTYVIEFKKDKTPEVALQQIIDKQYYEKFLVDQIKPIELIGMNFDYTSEAGVRLAWKI